MKVSYDVAVSVEHVNRDHYMTEDWGADVCDVCYGNVEMCCRGGLFEGVQTHERTNQEYGQVTLCTLTLWFKTHTALSCAVLF